jgi:hypothetical protein
MNGPTILLAALVNAAGADAPAAAVPTYSRDIAPIFQARCQECHRPGEAAPMPLISYSEVRPWARSIRKMVANREMPPWHADPAHGKWSNDPSLAAGESEKILAWADGGAPEGDPKDLPPPREFTEGWRIGKPDVVFTMPREFKVKATGEVRYQYIWIPTEFTEDKWIQAAEARPGNRKVVHHIIVFAVEPSTARPDLDLDGKDWAHGHICGTAPGEGPDVFPPGTGKLIKAGSRLLLQMHYTPTGVEETDRSSVGLVFAKEPPQHRLQVLPVATHRFKIPAGAEAHEVKARHTFQEDGVLRAFMPHMHVRGKSFRYDLVDAEGARRTILNVPRWDFGWQHNYLPAEPLQVKKGAVIECTAVFDNSKNNPSNPDPTKDVRWGDQTWEEMMIGFVTWTPATPDGPRRSKI